jgi:hypothetical protein
MNRTRFLPVVLLALGLSAGTCSNSAFAQAAPAPAAPAPTVVVAEAEEFTPGDAKGWKLTFQDDSYASHTYGGMWSSHGGLLGAPADAAGSVATRTVQIPMAGPYRVWSKYQAPPYYNYLHQLEIIQNGKTVFTYLYGKVDAPRLWSFGAQTAQLWWSCGVDHDTAEAPVTTVNLAAAPAELRLTAVANAQPAGDRFVDFIVLTTNPKDEYQGMKPLTTGSPFLLEAQAANRLYVRFQNTSAAAAKLVVTRPTGHVQPMYGGASASFPAEPVAAGQWSPWFNLGPFLTMVVDDGLTLKVGDAGAIPFQVARDPEGKDLAADLRVATGDPVIFPMDFIWNKQAKVMTTSEYQKQIIAAAKGQWRTANGGQKPAKLAYFGAVGGGALGMSLRDAMGYNTSLSDPYPHLAMDGLAHAGSVDAINALAKNTAVNKATLKVLSLGDEISLGEINWNDPSVAARFQQWLQTRKITAAELGADPATVKPAKEGDPRLVWYSNLFNEEERFGAYREMTRTAQQVLNPKVEVGANYSPHHLALYYGPIYQWVDLFKHEGMTLFWLEDYIFSVPELPQIYSWQLAEVRCGTKYHHYPIHSYVMPHAPGQLPSFLRRNMILAIGTGVQEINSFGVCPAETMTENYVAWRWTDTFRTLHESIYDSGEVEKYTFDGALRPGRVAVVLSKATDFQESRARIPREKDPFVARCANSYATVEQTLGRKDQQMLYLALRQAGQAVELITEDDIAQDGILKNFDVVYFAGEWIDNHAIPPLQQWVQAGGVLYATAGAGHLNQFGQPEPAMLNLLGLKDDEKISKNLYVIRTLLELPLAQPVDTITMDGQKIPAVALKQVLVPAEAKVLGTWSDGSAAVTLNTLGKGKVFTVGTLAGNTYMKTSLKQSPWARGGKHTVYNPTTWDPAATRLVRLGLDAAHVEPPVTTSAPLVEANVIDHAQGAVVSLVNWTDAPIKGVKVSLKLPWPPKAGRSVQDQKPVTIDYAGGTASFTTDLEYGNYIILEK